MPTTEAFREKAQVVVEALRALWEGVGGRRRPAVRDRGNIPRES